MFVIRSHLDGATFENDYSGTYTQRTQPSVILKGDACCIKQGPNQMFGEPEEESNFTSSFLTFCCSRAGRIMECYFVKRIRSKHA